MDAKMLMESGYGHRLPGMWLPAHGAFSDAWRFHWGLACKRIRHLHAACGGGSVVV